MKSSDLLENLEYVHKAGLAAFVKGPAGGGKTTLARQYAKKKGLRLVHCHAPLMDLLDVKGCISTAGDKAQFLPLEMWPDPEDGPVVILIDEFPQCVTAIQNAFSQMLIEQVMGDVRLPKGSFVIATGNRKIDKAATNNIPAHIVSRVLHIELQEDRDGWFNWASIEKLHHHVIAFIKFKPDALFTFDPSDSQSPYGCARSWAYVSDIIKSGAKDEFLQELISGLVGPGNASVFMAYRRTCLTLPDPQHILANPNTCQIPSDPGILYALCTGLSYYVTDTSCDNFITLANRIPTEFAIAMVKEGGNHCKGLRKNKSAIAWMQLNAKIAADSDWNTV
jgi:hypothetical protein